MKSPWRDRAIGIGAAPMKALTCITRFLRGGPAGFRPSPTPAIGLPPPIALLAIALLPMTLLAASAAAAAPPGRYLTGPSNADPLEIAGKYLSENRASLGLEAGDVADWVVSDRYTTPHNGVTHVYLRQRLGGI